MNTSTVSWIAFFALAGLVGFFADRTSICTVKAVEEILTTRRACMLLSFAKTVLWVSGVSIGLIWWLGAATPERLGFAITWPTICGGLLFGVGAVLNGGCAFATLVRLGNGNVGMVLTLGGFAAGVVICELAKVRGADIGYVETTVLVEFGFVSATAVGLTLCLLMIVEVARLWRTAPTVQWSTRLLAAEYRLSTAAAVIGVSNGILYTLLGTWSYTHTLRRSVGPFVTPAVFRADQVSMPMLWWLFSALVLGVLVSAALKRDIVVNWRPGKAWRGYLSGGMLMGVGAAMVPGGNDVLLLNAIPGLSPHALPAYISMLAGITIALMIAKKRGGRWHVVDCHGDRCTISIEGQSNSSS
ncbi:MAG: YeeE/YedE family protein [Gammaproteobacteria bacterium]|nr:YeeE/YedE family protein [Gammaproteobacteria bacterium]